jgi:enoyl-CoA hydratase
MTAAAASAGSSAEVGWLAGCRLHETQLFCSALAMMPRPLRGRTQAARARREAEAVLSPSAAPPEHPTLRRSPVPPSVNVEHRGAVQVITIDRPDVRNALDRAVAEAVAAAVDDLDRSSDLRVGVLTGAGGTFSSGMDLKAFLRGETPALEGRGLCGITETPPSKPMIAAVEGWALAGGLELVLACDLVVAGKSARFGVPEVKRGLVAATGAALLLPGRVASVHALEMLLTGEPIGALRAAEVGLINRVVEDGDALEEAIRLAETIAANAPMAVAVSKEIARGSSDWTREQGWSEQAVLVAPVLAGEDALEGAAAFNEKRKPVWRGR